MSAQSLDIDIIVEYHLLDIKQTERRDCYSTAEKGQGNDTGQVEIKQREKRLIRD